MSNRSRGFCFTINNYTFDDCMACIEIPAQYIIVGFEIAPTTGTPHIQGYCYFRNAVSFKSLQKQLKRARIVPAKGNIDQNYQYCSEDGDFIEIGERPNQGKRSDLDRMIEFIEDGGTIQGVKEAFPKQFFLYEKKIKAFINDKAPVKEKKRSLSLLHKANLYDIKDAIIINDFDDMRAYMGEKEVILDTALFTQPFHIERWWNGYPARIVRGYEVIKIDPDHVYFVYKNDLEYEKNKILLSQYIEDDVQEDFYEET